MMFRTHHSSFWSFWSRRGIDSIEKRGVTKVPAEYYDALLAALDDPPQPNKALIAATQKRRRFKQS